MFEEKRAMEWDRLNEMLSRYLRANLKDGRVDSLVLDARMDWDNRRERRAIRKMRHAVQILQRNILLQSEYDHIKGSVSDTRDSEKIHKLEKRYSIQVAKGKLRAAERTLRRIENDSDVASRVGNVTMELKTDGGYGIVAVVRNETDEPVTVREIKLRTTDGNERSVYAGLSTIDSRSVECYRLSNNEGISRDVYLYYERGGKSYTLSPGGFEYGY